MIIIIVILRVHYLTTLPISCQMHRDKKILVKRHSERDSILITSIQRTNQKPPKYSKTNIIETSEKRTTSQKGTNFCCPQSVHC